MSTNNPPIPTDNNPMSDDSDHVLAAINKAQQHLNTLAVGMPKCVRPALMDAMTMWLGQGDIPAFVNVDYGRAAVLVPDTINGRDVWGFMSRVMAAHNAETCSHSFESVSDNIVVLEMTAAALYKLTAKAIANGNDRSVGEWTLTTYFPKP